MSIDEKEKTRIGKPPTSKLTKNTLHIHKPRGDHERVSFRRSMLENIVGHELSDMTDDEQDKKNKEIKLAVVGEEPKERPHLDAPQSQVNNDPHRLVHLDISSRISNSQRIAGELRSRDSIVPASDLRSGPSNRTSQSGDTAGNSRGRHF
jgi:hypothetical protein